MKYFNVYFTNLNLSRKFSKITSIANPVLYLKTENSFNNLDHLIDVADSLQLVVLGDLTDLRLTAEAARWSAEIQSQ